MYIQRNGIIDSNFMQDSITNAKEVHIINREESQAVLIIIKRDNGIIDDYIIPVGD